MFQSVVNVPVDALDTLAGLLMNMFNICMHCILSQMQVYYGCMHKLYMYCTNVCMHTQYVAIIWLVHTSILEPFGWCIHPFYNHLVGAYIHFRTIWLVHTSILEPFGWCIHQC